MLNKFRLDEDDKRGLIFRHSNGRTLKTKELTYQEGYNILSELSGFDSMDIMRKKVFALSREIGFAYGNSREDNKMNLAKINRFLLKYGTVKKKLNDLRYKELVQVISQFEAMAKSHQKKQMTEAIKQIQELLKN